MLKADAVRYFGDQAKIAQRLGISAAAVYQWPDLVPEKRAMQLERLTAGSESNGVVLRYDSALYFKAA